MTTSRHPYSAGEVIREVLRDRLNQRVEKVRCELINEFQARYKSELIAAAAELAIDVQEFYDLRENTHQVEVVLRVPKEKNE